MVRKIECACNLLDEEIEIKSLSDLNNWKEYFSLKVSENVFKEIVVDQPYYIVKGTSQTIEWYADKWYKCLKCNAILEVKYPDFPANGFIRKIKK